MSFKPLDKVWVSLHQFCKVREQPPIWRVAANILNKWLQTANKEWSSSLGVGQSADNSSL